MRAPPEPWRHAARADKAGAYSWCKAPRLDGAVVEVGALARQVVDGIRWFAIWSPPAAVMCATAWSRACSRSPAW